MTTRPAIRRLCATIPFWLPALLLVSVAANQIRLVRSESLSPWSGGGFGMFSTTDAPGNRHLHAFVQNESVRREVTIPRDLADSVRRATTLPTRTRLGALAAKLASRESAGTMRWREIELQVWSIDYDASLRPTGRLLRKERIPIALR